MPSASRFPLPASRSSLQRGFTLVELLITVAIIGIVSSYSIFYYYFFQLRSRLNSTSAEISQTLRRAQSRALAGEGAEKFGVHFEEGKFILFGGDFYLPNDPNNESFEIPKGLELYDVNLQGGGVDVVFNELDGITDDYGSLSLKISDGTSATISINREGTVAWRQESG